MAQRKKKVTVRPLRLENKGWARFCTAYHGRGAHQDKTAYRRRKKHSSNWYEDN